MEEEFEIVHFILPSSSFQLECQTLRNCYINKVISHFGRISSTPVKSSVQNRDWTTRRLLNDNEKFECSAYFSSRFQINSSTHLNCCCLTQSRRREKLTGKLMKMLCCVKNKSIILFSDWDCFSSSSLRLRLNSQDSGSGAGDSTLNLVKVYDVFVSCSMFFVRLCSISPVARIAPCFCLADNLSCLIPKVFWIC